MKPLLFTPLSIAICIGLLTSPIAVNAAHWAGFGRNEIDRQLREQGVRVSHGSITNIINKYKKKQSLQSNATIIEQSSSLPSQPEADSTISIGIDMDNTRSPVSRRQGVGPKPTIVPTDGGPLSHLLNEDTSGNPDSTNLTPSPKPEFVDFDNKPYPEFYPVEPDVINQDVNSPEEEYHRPKPLGTWDPDSDELLERRFWARIMDEKKERRQELQLIENGRRELEEGRQQIEQMRQSFRQQINDLKAKTAEVELLLPLARQFKMMNVNVTNFLPWVDMVQNYAETHGTDLTTAAFDIKKNLEAYGELEVIKHEIKKAEAYWSALGKAIREDKQAITDLIYLRRTGCGKRDLKRLGEVIRGQRLDTELINVGTSKNNGSSHSTHLTQGNGNNGLSMNNYLRLQLLQASTSNILTKLGVKN